MDKITIIEHMPDLPDWAEEAMAEGKLIAECLRHAEKECLQIPVESYLVDRIEALTAEVSELKKQRFETFKAGVTTGIKIFGKSNFEDLFNSAYLEYEATVSGSLAIAAVEAQEE